MLEWRADLLRAALRSHGPHPPSRGPAFCEGPTADGVLDTPEGQAPCARPGTRGSQCFVPRCRRGPKAATRAAPGARMPASSPESDPQTAGPEPKGAPAGCSEAPMPLCTPVFLLDGPGGEWRSRRGCDGFRWDQTFVSVVTWGKPRGAVSEPLPGHWLQGAPGTRSWGRDLAHESWGVQVRREVDPGWGGGPAQGRMGECPGFSKDRRRSDRRLESHGFLEGFLRQETWPKAVSAGWGVSVMNMCKEV